MRESEADAVVIGAGALGASTAYHLAKAGLRVTVVERRSMATGCSSATSAAINISAKEGDCYVKFTLDASRLFADIERELEADLEYSRDGSVPLIVERESEWPAVLQEIEQMNRVPGVNAEALRGSAIRDVEPEMPDGIPGIAYCPADGRLNPFRLVAAYLRAARRLGATIHLETEVTSIQVRNGAVEGVTTSRGAIRAPWVIAAAGIDTPALGRMVGATIPVVPAHGQVMTTVPVRPFLRHDIRGLRQLPSHNVNVGSTKAYLGPTKQPRLQPIPGVSEKAVQLFPFLAKVPVQRIWVGLRPWPIDGLPIVGPVRDVGGFLVAATHSGITLSAMIGHVLTDLVVKGRTGAEVHHYRPDRFAGDQMSYLTKMYRQTLGS